MMCCDWRFFTLLSISTVSFGALASSFEASRRLSSPYHSANANTLLNSFDFSSHLEWDKFYEDNPCWFEWHDSVPLERIASHIPHNSDCLMVGCGNSMLPAVTLFSRTSTRINLLDTSPKCIEQLKEFYGSALEYTLGDATRLTTLFPPDKRFDIIVDKGLTDAILCGEGFDTFLERLYQEASQVLRCKSGLYLLISYRLSKSNKDFLTEIGDSVEMDWEFDLPDSNDRVSVSMARKR